MNSGYDRLLLCLVQMKVFSTLHFCFSTNLNIIRKMEVVVISTSNKQNFTRKLS